MSRLATLLIVIPSLALLAACKGEPDARPGSDAAGVERIIATQAQRAQTRSNDGAEGVELQFAGAAHYAGTAMSNSVRTSGEGDMTVGLKAHRLDGQAMRSMEVVLGRVQVREGEQPVGDGSAGAAYVEVTGVPGREGALLRSVDGALVIDALGYRSEGKPNAVDAHFKGRFAEYDAQGEAFVGGTAADAIDVSGSIRFQSSW